MQIGVVGSWSRDLDKAVYEIAEEVGKRIARKGDILITGGSTGIMEAAMKGAKSEKGLTVGFIPAECRDKYQFLGRFIDIFIMTGTTELGKLAPLINSVEGIIAIAGGAGTLIEICMAYLQDKPIVLIPIPQCTSDKVKHLMEDGYLDYRKTRKLRTAQTAKEAVDLLYAEITGKPSP